MINMVSITSLTLNLTLNQMKVKNTDTNTNTKCSSELLKSIDIGIKILKHRIYQIYISCSFISIFQRVYSKVN